MPVTLSSFARSLTAETAFDVLAVARRLMAAGKTNLEIGRALFRSPNTIANHVRNILGKTQTANRAEASAFAVRHGLVAPE